MFKGLSKLLVNAAKDSDKKSNQGLKEMEKEWAEWDRETEEWEREQAQIEAEREEIRKRQGK